MTPPDNKTVQTPRIAVILAGGGSRRMGTDKAVVELGGRRLIDHVADRLKTQTDLIVISGAKDYGTGFPVIADRNDGPLGPAAGVFSTACWIKDNLPHAKAFVTAPVDGPFLPEDLISKLFAEDACAVACTSEGLHPTFSSWNIAQTLAALQRHEQGEGVALHKLAEDCSARHVHFSPDWRLMNINTPEDLEEAKKILSE